MITRLNHEVKTSTVASKPTINKNTVAAPVMNPTRQDNYPRRQQEHNHRYQYYYPALYTSF